MAKNTSDRNPCDVKINPRCFGAALHLRGLTLAGLARDCKRSRRHLHFIVIGARPLSPYIERVLRDALGPDGWNFATGKVDVLRAKIPTAEGANRAAE